MPFELLATADDIRQFQADQIASGAQPPKMNTQASALRFFFTMTVGLPDLSGKRISPPRFELPPHDEIPSCG